MAKYRHAIFPVSVVFYFLFCDWIVSKIPYIHVIILPFFYKWAASVFFVVIYLIADKLYFSDRHLSKYHRQRLQAIAVGIGCLWLLHIAWWVFIYASGGI